MTQPCLIIGTVQPGEGYGTKTGTPTANLPVELAQGLPKGLYACTVQFSNQYWPGLLYYGYNSLTDEDCLEVHLLDFSGSLHKKTITVRVGEYVREEKRFNNAEDLRKQIEEDIRLARQRISNES